MAWKFYNIAKANARIDELEAEVAAVKAAPGAAPPAPTADKITALEKQISEMSASVADLGDKIANLEQTANTAIASTGKFTVEIARIDKALVDVTPEKIGSRIAAEITARQGQPPLQPGAQAGGGNGTGTDLEAQLQAIEDPRKRAEFFKAHERELKMKRNGKAN